ncbi:MAG TPA: Wzz/FepE/Etk N-terminal domain-containing protein [Terriglobales bacterium]|nr:Wzz/FepE/Etk N-terminal domain-containing protein [Terriglobales bacterium]
MMENRDLTLDDYLATLRRRSKLILIPAIIAPLVGFLISYAFTPKYTSRALVLVEGQKVPEGVVQPVVTSDLAQRIATMQQQVIGRNRLQPIVERRPGLFRGGKSLDDVLEDVASNLSIDPVMTDLSSIGNTGGGARRRPGQGGGVPGFYVSFTAANPHDAQDVCNDLTSAILTQFQNSREEVAISTTDFISRQLEEAKRNLDDQDAKLAAFKRQYVGQLPGDEENNLKVLGALNSQLDANTQAVNRAQQDKSYTESMLSQQLAAWKSSQGSSNPQSLEMQLTNLQSQLLSLQARYTDDHPDVIKTKADIAEVKKKLAEVNEAAAKGGDPGAKASAVEPAEIRQLRLQVHQYDEVLAQATREQKRLSEQIRQYQSRVAVSPEVEEKYKQVTRDYDTAQKFYADLLAKKSASEMATDMEKRQQGEQMHLLNAAILPEAPSFPNRPLFAAGGLGAGLVIGMGLALWMELRDKAIRNEADVIASLQMPVLVSLPWVTEEVEKNGKGKLWNRDKDLKVEHEKVGV